jgi:hypothetical protein
MNVLFSVIPVQLGLKHNHFLICVRVLNCVGNPDLDPIEAGPCLLVPDPEIWGVSDAD